MLVSASTAARSIIISALDIHSAWTALEDLLAIHPDLLAFGRVFAVAFAVGLDVFAISLAVGTAQLNRNASLRVGIAFASAEIVMQVVGYGLGTGANHIFGEVAVYVGFALLACIGVMMFGNSFQHSSEAKFDATHGVGLLIASLSISLDSLGIGIALPALGIPLLPLLTTVSMTTTVFTLIGLSFGARLGERYERNAERAAGMILVVLAVLFAFQRLRSRL
jgi:putative Mn2+ efflux pump MntP